MGLKVGDTVGDYVISGVLGVGGMGTVFRVRNLISDREEALKVLLPNLTGSPELAERFAREIKIHASLDHPNIASLRTAIRINNQLLMIMELVDGVTLERRLEQGPVQIPDTLAIANQVLLSRFFVSLEDELWRLFGDRANHPLLRTWEEHLSMDNKILSTMIQRAQKKVEEHYFEARKNTLNYDDVMNRQRELIYRERRRILEGVNLKETILHYIDQNIEDAVNSFTSADVSPADWDLDQLFHELDEYFMLTPTYTVNDLQGKSRNEMIDMLKEFVHGVYESRDREFDELQGPDTMRELERWMALRAINAKWMEHLANMDYLREGIHLRSYEQKDPLLIYQKEAFDEFERMQQAIQDDIVRNIFRIQIVQEPPPQPVMPVNIAPAIPLPPEITRPKYAQMQDLEMPRELSTNRDIEVAGAKPKRNDGAPADWKGGRNDPCWCGSGKKYKKCHGA